VGALVCAYLVWQPLRSADADANAVNEAVHGDDAAALTDARSAVNAFPMSLSALEELAAIQSAVGQPAQARATLLRATRDQPENPAAWGALGEYELAAHRFRLAIPALQREAVLNLSSGESGVDREIVYAVAHERPAPG
jgi:tetratricopeptide (TPR) repeat protein